MAHLLQVILCGTNTFVRLVDMLLNHSKYTGQSTIAKPLEPRTYIIDNLTALFKLSARVN